MTERTYRQHKPRRAVIKGSHKPELMLAAAIIEQAFEDLRKFNPKTNDKDRHTKWYSAAKFLLGYDTNLDWMAAGVGVDVEVIRTEALKIVKEKLNEAFD